MAHQSIAEIRKTIRHLAWARQWHQGGTADENRRADLPALLAPTIAEVRALDIPARFAADIALRDEALVLADATLARWRASQKIVPFNP